MPISLASNATASRIFSASRPSVISASGSEPVVKIRLKNQLRRDPIAEGGEGRAAGGGRGPREARPPGRLGGGPPTGPRRPPEGGAHRSRAPDQRAHGPPGLPPRLGGRGRRGGRAPIWAECAR